MKSPIEKNFVNTLNYYYTLQLHISQNCEIGTQNEFSTRMYYETASLPPSSPAYGRSFDHESSKSSLMDFGNSLFTRFFMLFRGIVAGIASRRNKILNFTQTVQERAKVAPKHE
jgi:hypothetical protein